MSAISRNYRPQRFADVAEQAHVVRTLVNQLVQQNVAQVYVFSGPRGVGKTTIARLLAKALQCTDRAQTSPEPCGACASCVSAQTGKMMDTIEIDAASQTGVDAVRENIIEGVRFGPAMGKKKVFIIDEVHMLSTASFNALLKTLEEPPSHAVFILATTELHKIPATVLSRCQRFAFTRIPAQAMVARLGMLAQAEHRTVAPEVLFRIAQLSEGCLRDGENMLGQVIDALDGDIDLARAGTILPESTLALIGDLAELLASGAVQAAALRVQAASQEGASLRHVHDDLIAYVQAMIFMLFGERGNNAYDEASFARLTASAKSMGSARAIALLDALLQARTRQAPALLPEVPLQVAFFTWGLQGAEKAQVAPDIAPPSFTRTDGAFAYKQPENATSQHPTPHTPSPIPTPNTPPPIPTPNTPPPLERTDVASANDVPTDATSLRPLLADIRSKWARCLEKAKSVGGPGYGIMVGVAECAGLEGDTVLVSFPYKMHADRMHEAKNSKILSDAIAEVCLFPQVRVKMVHQDAASQAPEEAGVESLLSAFGGSVIG